MPRNSEKMLTNPRESRRPCWCDFWSMPNCRCVAHLWISMIDSDWGCRQCTRRFNRPWILKSKSRITIEEDVWLQIFAKTKWNKIWGSCYIQTPTLVRPMISCLQLSISKWYGPPKFVGVLIPSQEKRRNMKIRIDLWGDFLGPFFGSSLII